MAATQTDMFQKTVSVLQQCPGLDIITPLQLWHMNLGTKADSNMSTGPKRCLQQHWVSSWMGEQLTSKSKWVT